MAVERKDAKKSDKKKDEVSQEENIFNEEKSHTEEEGEGVVVEAKDDTDKEPVMTVKSVEDMLKTQEERWSQKFNKLMQSVKLGKAKDELQEGAEYIADLTEDWLDTPVVFFAYSINFSIHGDKKRGVESSPPQGAIRFKPIVRTKRSGRKGEEVISVSSVKVHSKSVAEYLRNHSQFGIAFFENMDDVLNMNTNWAQKLIEANSSIQRLSDQQIIARCQQEGLPIGTDIIKMRKSLVESVAEKSVKRYDEMMYGKLKNAVIDAKTERQIIEK
jgi:hypothetical protein